MINPIGRGIAAFLGSYTILNLLGDLRFARGDANLWWIDFRPLPLPVSRILLAAIGVALLLRAMLPATWRGWRLLTTALIGTAFAAALANAVRFYVLLARGDIATTIPLPLSLLVAVVLAIVLFAGAVRPRDGRSIAIFSFVAAALLFPLAQISLFGVTDYRRPADLIVVFGAHAYADGHPSDALADRVRTACALYREGLAPRLLFSGGPGDGAFTEPEVMRMLAMTLGVPAAAITLDANGLNTEASVRDTLQMFPGRPLRILAVSHFYHLPRIKMTYARYGLDVRTVPSEDSVKGSMFFNIPREVAAFWAYYLRGFRGVH